MCLLGGHALATSALLIREGLLQLIPLSAKFSMGTILMLVEGKP